jgi:hypothetical protein
MVITQEQVYGDITLERARELSELIKGNVLQEEFGSENIISFLGSSEVLIHRHDKTNDSRLKDYYAIAKGLERAGINVVKIKGMYSGDPSLLLAERLYLKNYRDLNRLKQREMETQFREQLYLAMNKGFEPGDITLEDNCGFDLKQNKIRFFDVADWRG